MRKVARLAPMVLLVVVASCSGSAGQQAGTSAPAGWAQATHVRGVVDLAIPRPGGTIVVAARGRLWLLGPNGPLRPFAAGYAAPPGLEPYIVLVDRSPSSAGCRFVPGTIYALRLRGGNGVTAVSPAGRVRRFARLPSAGLENGIAYDTTGRFGHRLLVTRADHGVATVYAIDCGGHVRTITRMAPAVEGGIVVAPRGFGRFGGDLIAPDEHSGNLYAIAPAGRVTLLARSGVPHGQDVGVESLGFVPTRFRRALVADRHSTGNAHSGDDAILELRRSYLSARGVRRGDLLAVTEGGAVTIAVRCVSTCTVRRIASGPAKAHVEGHVTFSTR